jgi:hypothetical protein
MDGRSGVPFSRFTFRPRYGISGASPPPDFRPCSPTIVLSEHHAALRSCQAVQYQQALNRPYLELTKGLGPPSSVTVWWRPENPLGGPQQRFVIFDPQAYLLGGVSPVRAATALHDMDRALAAFTTLVQLTGRLHRHGLATPATTAGLRLLFAMAARGQAETALAAAARLAEAWGAESGVPAPSAELEWALAEILWSEFLRTRPWKVSRQRASALVGRAVGLTRSAARNTRSLLSPLITLCATAFPRRDDQLGATSSRGRVYLRSALSGSGTGNAPPPEPVVRTLGMAGISGLPPMVLVA